MCELETQTAQGPKERSNILFIDLEMVELLADGLQVALLGETRQQCLHAVVELVFTVELERKRRQRLKQRVTKQCSRTSNRRRLYKSPTCHFRSISSRLVVFQNDKWVYFLFICTSQVYFFMSSVGRGSEGSKHPWVNRVIWVLIQNRPFLHARLYTLRIVMHLIS